MTYIEFYYANSSDLHMYVNIIKLKNVLEIYAFKGADLINYWFESKDYFYV